MAVIAMSSSSLAQESPESSSPFPTGFGIGGHLSQIQRDFGLGLNITSPTFFNDRAAVRVRGGIAYLEHVDGNGEITWTQYSSFQAGLIGFSGSIAGGIRCYGEGGLIMILPNETFSSESSVLGGYGLFGFEFFLSQGLSYFIELGGAGTGANADKVAGNPIYSNGFIIGTGVRYTF